VSPVSLASSRSPGPRSSPGFPYSLIYLDRSVGMHHMTRHDLRVPDRHVRVPTKHSDLPERHVQHAARAPRLARADSDAIEPSTPTGSSG
jgi:hypothetical protein